MTTLTGPLTLFGRQRPARFVFQALVVALTFAFCASGPISHVSAQDDAAGEFGGADPAEEAPADAGGGDGAGVGEADGGGGEEDAPKNDGNLLTDMIAALGISYSLVFLLISVTLVSLLVMNLLAARRDTLCPPELIEAFEEKLNNKEFQEAYDMARTDESVLGQVLSAGLPKVSQSYSKAIEAMQEIGEEESMKLEHRLSYMALIGNLSPMIGLFGTVQGMIASFQVIARSTNTPSPAELAKGISTALFTTLVGLAIAIPAIAAYNILRNRVSRLLLEVGVQSENLMSRFEDVEGGGAA